MIYINYAKKRSVILYLIIFPFHICIFVLKTSYTFLNTKIFNKTTHIFKRKLKDVLSFFKKSFNFLLRYIYIKKRYINSSIKVQFYLWN